MRTNARFWEVRRCGDLRLLHGPPGEHRFTPHFHYCYSIGVVLSGAMEYEHCQQRGVVGAGSIFLINPGEVHSARGHEGGHWSFRSFYLGERRLGEQAARMGRPASTPLSFRSPIVDDPELARRLEGLHRAMESVPERSERAFFVTLTELIERYALARGELPSPTFERHVVARARGFIEERQGEHLLLSAIAGHVGLSPYHFQRVFQTEVGLTPHRYLTQVRLRRARALLTRGMSISQTASLCGFADQSHLTRHFKRILGCTPGEFARACRGSRPFPAAHTVGEWLGRVRGLTTTL